MINCSFDFLASLTLVRICYFFLQSSNITWQYNRNTRIVKHAIKLVRFKRKLSSSSPFSSRRSSRFSGFISSHRRSAVKRISNVSPSISGHFPPLLNLPNRWLMSLSVEIRRRINHFFVNDFDKVGASTEGKMPSLVTRVFVRSFVSHFICWSSQVPDFCARDFGEWKTHIEPTLCSAVATLHLSLMSRRRCCCYSSGMIKVNSLIFLQLLVIRSSQLFKTIDRPEKQNALFYFDCRSLWNELINHSLEETQRRVTLVRFCN